MTLVCILKQVINILSHAAFKYLDLQGIPVVNIEFLC